MNHFPKNLLCLLMLSLVFFGPLKLFSEPNTVLVLNNPVNSGFGAIFSSALAALDKYERENYAGIIVDLNSGIYLDPEQGPNYWEYFFEPIRLGNATDPQHVLNHNEVSCMVNDGFLIPRRRAYELIQKYVHIKPYLQRKIDSFVNKNFEGCYVIGVHHRGTDKKVEAPIVPYETTLFHVNWWMSNMPKGTKAHIFVSTDDQNFLDHIRQLYPHQVVYNNFIRSTNDRPLHYGAGDMFESNYQKGEEAILDMILLSKCNLLLFPAASAFSMASLKFNPNLAAIPLAGNR